LLHRAVCETVYICCIVPCVALYIFAASCRASGNLQDLTLMPNRKRPQSFKVYGDVVQSSSWEADSHSAGQKIARVLWNRKASAPGHYPHQMVERNQCFGNQFCPHLQESDVSLVTVEASYHSHICCLMMRTEIIPETLVSFDHSTCFMPQEDFIKFAVKAWSHCFHKRSPLDPILSQLNPFHILTLFL